MKFLVDFQLQFHYFDNIIQFLKFYPTFCFNKMHIALQYFKKLYTFIKFCADENRIKILGRKLICRADDHKLWSFCTADPFPM